MEKHQITKLSSTVTVGDKEYKKTTAIDNIENGRLFRFDFDNSITLKKGDIVKFTISTEEEK